MHQGARAAAYLQEDAKRDRFVFHACYMLLFATMTVDHALRMLPTGDSSDRDFPPSFLLASLARLMYESIFAFAYYVDTLHHPETRALRARVIDYHELKSAVEMANAMSYSFPDSKEKRRELKAQRELLEKDPRFESLPDGLKGQIRGGKSDRTMLQAEVFEEIDLDDGLLASRYAFLSKHAHVTSYSVAQMNEQGARPETIPDHASTLLMDFLLPFSAMLDMAGEAFSGLPLDSNTEGPLTFYRGVRKTFHRGLMSAKDWEEDVGDGD